MKAIISGASKGIGKAIARKLAAAGYDLFLMSRKESDLSELKAELQKDHEVAIEFLPIDLSEPNSIKQIDFGTHPTDKLILINNVGEYFNDQASKINIEKLDQLMRTNLYAAIKLSKQLEEQLFASQESLIVNILSFNSLNSDPKASSYSISKHAFKAWNDGLREEYRSQGVKVSAIYPGAVNTSSWDGIDVDRSSMVQPEDVAKLVLSLSEMSTSSLLKEIHIDPLNFDPS